MSSPTAVLGGLATIAENPEVVMSFSRMDAGSVVPAASSKLTCRSLTIDFCSCWKPDKTRLSRFDCDEKGLFVRDRFPYVPSLVQSFLILETRQVHPIGKIETIDYYRCFSFCTLFALLCYMFAPQAPFDWTKLSSSSVTIIVRPSSVDLGTNISVQILMYRYAQYNMYEHSSI